MKRLLAAALACIFLLTGCTTKTAVSTGITDSNEVVTSTEIEIAARESGQNQEEEPMPESSDTQPLTDDYEDNASVSLTDVNYSGLNDPMLLQNVEDIVYSELVSTFGSEDYIIENVQAIYISKEYLEELEYNSQANIFFGYTLAELDEQFQGTRYVFALDENGETTVQKFENYDDTYDKVLRNVAIGTGVILLCVTVSVATGGAGLVPISMVFAASAKTAATMAVSSALIGGVSAGIVEGIRTHDIDAALKAAALSGSEGFKWGAISGAIVGGATKLSAIHRASNAVEGATEYAKGTVEIADDIPRWRQAELRALNKTGGYEQLSYLNGEQVPFGTPNATRPDVVRLLGDHIEAVEVKYYDLENPSCLSTLYSELEREVSARLAHLPSGSTQRIILDVTGRGFSETTCTNVMNTIWSKLDSIYKNIPIEIEGLL